MIKRIFVAILILLFAGCSFAQFKEYTDKGAKVYVLISDNQELIKEVYDQIQATEKAYKAWQDNKNLEQAFVDEIIKLYDVNIKARKFLKELKQTFDE